MIIINTFYIYYIKINILVNMAVVQLIIIMILPIEEFTS